MRLGAGTVAGSGSGGPPASAAALVILTLVGSALAGFAAVALPLAETLVVCVAGMAVLGAIFLRRALRGVSSPTGVERIREEIGEPVGVEGVVREPWDLRFSRMLFYLGTALVAEAAWRPALGLTVSELLFISAFGGCLFVALRGHPVASLPLSLTVGVFLFVFGGTLSSISAASPSESGTEVLHAIYVMLLWAWTGVMVLRSRRQILVAMTLWVVSAAVGGLGAITQVFGVDALTGPLEGNRATGFAQHPNDLGGATAVALVPALFLATRSAFGQAPWTRTLQWTLVGLVATGLVLSASVAGMAAALVGIIFWLSSPSVRASGRVAVVAALAAILVIGSLAGGRVTSPTERLEQVTSRLGTRPGTGSGEERVSIVKRAWPRIKEDPLIGTGLDATGTVVTITSGGQTRPYQAHGAPLAAWYEAGIFGLVGILVVFGALARAGWRALAGTESDTDLLLGWALLGALAAFAVYALTAPLFFQQYGWLAAVMLLAWRSRREETLAVSVSTQAPGPGAIRLGSPVPIPR